MSKPLENAALVVDFLCDWTFRFGFMQRGVIVAGFGLLALWGLRRFVWPALAAIYFQWLLYGGPRLSRWIPIIMLGIVVAMLPFNIVTGFQEAEKYRDTNIAWEKSVRDGLSDDELIDKYYSNYFGELKLRMRTGLHLLRKHRFQYYRPLDASPPSRIGPRRRRASINRGFT